MESTILLTIKQRLYDELEIDKSLIDRFIDLLEDYTSGDYLYYEYFKSEIGVSDEDFILITNVIIRMGLVEKIYKLLCPTCGKISRTFYRNLKEIRDTHLCERCDSDLIKNDEINKYILVFFRMVSDEQ